MATDLQRTKPTGSPKKYDSLVEAQLSRARQRIRGLDLAAAVFGWLILTLAYGLILALADRALEFSALTRQAAFAVYLTASLVYGWLLIVRPLLRPINPYYAARRLEQTLPHAKNSVINWLDLHEQALAPALRGAIGQQAAHDLAEADLEQAVSARRTSWLGATTAILSVALLVLFVLSPRQFLSLMNRAFAPFIEAPIATRTRLLLVQPEQGDITLPVGRAVAIAVWVEGRVPDPSSAEALQLLYRYNRSDPYQSRLLERGESTRDWLTKLLAGEVHQGFWYKIVGGDAETPEYRVQVRSTPLLTGFDVTYHYRPYLGWPDRITHEQNLQDLRGTEVTLLARTNRVVQEGQLVIDAKAPIEGEKVAEDPQALRFRLRLEEDGQYRIWFKSVEAERNLDPMPYTIRALQDRAPQVELIKPGEDSQLPANGILRLEGSASDDFGLVGLNLRLKIENGPALQPKPYRKGDKLRRGDGSYPQMLAYQEFVELDKLQREDQQRVEPLRPGTQIEYWLEATDNCDYPGPNIGESKHFKVTIQKPQTDPKKQEQQRQEAQQDQQKHNAKQDQDLQNQKQEPREPSPEQKAAPQNDAQSGKQGEQQNAQSLEQQKEKIENAIKEHEQQQKANGKGEAKPDASQTPKGENKGEGQAGGSGNPGQNQEQKPNEAAGQPGQQKGQGKQASGAEKGEPKGDGQGASRSTESGEKPRRGQSSEPPANPGEAKDQKGADAQGSGQPKPSDAANPKPTPSSSGGEGAKKEQASAAAQQGEKSRTPQRPDGNTGSKQEPSRQSPSRASESGEHKPQPDGQGAEPRAGNSKPEPQGERNAAKPSGTPEQAGQPKNAGQQGNAEKGQAKQQERPAGNSATSDKSAAGEPRQQPPMGAERPAGEPRPNQGEGTRGEPKAGHPAGAPEQSKTGDAQQQAGTAKPRPSNEAKGGNGAEKTQQQPMPSGTDKSGTGARSTPGAEKRTDRENAAGAGAPKVDKGEAKDKQGAGSGADRQAMKKAQEALSKLAEELKSGDEQTRAAARKQLEQLRDQARDPAARRAAEEALERAGQGAPQRTDPEKSGTKPGEPKGQTGTPRPDQPAPADKGNPDAPRQNADKGPGQRPGQANPGSPERAPSELGNGKQDRNGDTPESGKPSAGSGRPGGSGASGKEGGNDPSPPGPNPQQRRDNPPSRPADPPPTPTPANAAYQKQAGELQLEEIRKKLNKDVLKQLNMTEADFEKFAKAYQEMLQRKQATGNDKEQRVGPQRGNRTLPNQGVRLVEPGTPGKAGSLQRLGPTAAPPEFREAYKEFSRQISELERTNDKK